jgi:hypothetical protein
MGSGAQVLTSGTNVPFGLMKTRIPIFTRALFHFEQGQAVRILVEHRVRHMVRIRASHVEHPDDHHPLDEPGAGQRLFTGSRSSRRSRVSTLKFPDSREFAGNFHELGADSAILVSNRRANSVAWSQISYTTGREFF